jgi:hypothetical protein
MAADSRASEESHRKRARTSLLGERQALRERYSPYEADFVRGDVLRRARLPR